MARNITKVYLLDVPLENDYKNTLYFANASAQQQYFQSKVVKSYTDFSYQRKDHVIRIPEEYDEIATVNYVMYQNSAYSNKWFYAFITDLKYVNDGMTEAVIETDVIQTWLFDYTVKSSFVEREHVSNDAIGLHTIPEGLETGDYVRQPGTEITAQVKDLWYTADAWICVASTEYIPGYVGPSAGERLYGRVYSGLSYLIFRNANEVDKYIRAMEQSFANDPIVSIFMIPKDITNISTTDFSSYTVSGETFEACYCDYSSSPAELGSVYFIKENYLDSDYVPRNKKLLTYPYRYLVLSNNAGSSAEYRYEFFDSVNCEFTIRGVISPGCSIKIYPENYKPGRTINSLDGAKLPTCSWSNDSYINWLTQNSINMPLDNIKNVASIVGGVALTIGTGGLSAVAGAGLVGTGIMGIFDQVKAKYEHSLVPETAKGGVNQGDLNFSIGETYSYYKMSIRKEYAQIIDGYFDMFGYQVNAVKVPNKNHRSRWWYTKCIDVSIDGDIPQDDMGKIKNCYNSGIRFWRNASEIENFSLSNGIV